MYEDLTKEEIEEIKKVYTPGKRIELICMRDIQAPKPGTTGTVDHVDGMGTIHMNWDTGGSLGLIVNEDEFKLLD